MQENATNIHEILDICKPFNIINSLYYRSDNFAILPHANTQPKSRKGGGEKKTRVTLLNKQKEFCSDRLTCRCEAPPPSSNWAIWQKKEAVIFGCYSRSKLKINPSRLWSSVFMFCKTWLWLPSPALLCSAGLWRTLLQHGREKIYRLLWKIRGVEAGPWVLRALNEWIITNRPDQSTACLRWCCALWRWPFSTRSGSRWSETAGEWHLGRG